MAGLDQNTNARDPIKGITLFCVPARTCVPVITYGLTLAATIFTAISIISKPMEHSVAWSAILLDFISLLGTLNACAATRRLAQANKSSVIAEGRPGDYGQCTRLGT